MSADRSTRTALAACCVAYGIDGVVIESVELPVLGAGDIEVAVELAGIGHSDVLVVQNRYQVTAPLPFIPGSEFGGVVAAAGDAVQHVHVGDRVVGTMFVGACAERIVAPAATVRRIAADADFATVIAGGISYETAYHSLRSVAAVRPGETVLVLGAGGGVGLAAVDIAGALGATVVAAASDAHKLQAATDAGASIVVDYSGADFRAALKAAVPAGVDVVLDPVGGRWSEPALRSLRAGGRFVTIGYASGEIPAIPLNLVLLKAISILGFEFRTFAASRADEFVRNGAEMYDLLAAKRLRPRIAAIHPLRDLPAALRSIADRRAIGKVLIDVRN